MIATINLSFDVNFFYLLGPPAELLEMFGISANNIVKAVNEVIKQ